jgi:hypothetical protein
LSTVVRNPTARTTTGFLLNLEDDRGALPCLSDLVMRVLVAVRPAMAAELLAAWLVGEGYDVVSEASAARQETDVDVAICDHPLGDGVRAGRLIDVSVEPMTMDVLRALI